MGKDEIIRQIHQMYKQGIGGFICPEAGSWMNTVRLYEGNYCRSKEAESLGMKGMALC